MYTSDVESTEAPVLSEKSQFDRFKGAQWFHSLLNKKVIVGGAGGIGSWTSLLLSRIGCRLYIFDFDIVSSINMAGQLYMEEDIGKLKTIALRNIISKLSDGYVNIYSKYTPKSPTGEIVFSCFDNMLSRKVLFNNWVKQLGNYKDPIFIDGRLNMESFQIFCVTKDKIKEYKKFLFKDSEIEDVECTIKQTSHCAAMIASHMVGFLTNHYSEGRQVPFYYEYILPVNYVNLCTD